MLKNLVFDTGMNNYWHCG